MPCVTDRTVRSLSLCSERETSSQRLAVSDTENCQQLRTIIGLWIWAYIASSHQELGGEVDDGGWKSNRHHSATCRGIHFGNGKNQDQKNSGDNNTNNDRLGPGRHLSSQRTKDFIRRSLAGSTYLSAG